MEQTYYMNIISSKWSVHIAGVSPFLVLKKQAAMNASAAKQ
jgi:hypothetical protein